MGVQAGRGMRGVGGALVRAPPRGVSGEGMDEMVKGIAKRQDESYAELKAQGRIG